MNERLARLRELASRRSSGHNPCIQLGVSVGSQLWAMFTLNFFLTGFPDPGTGRRKYQECVAREKRERRTKFLPEADQLQERSFDKNNRWKPLTRAIPFRESCAKILE